MRFVNIILFLLISLFSHAQVSELELLGQWKDSTLVGSSTYDNTYNEVWGLARNGHEYAVVGSTAGTHFIDVTDPRSPFEAFFIQGNASGGVIIHRDYHDSGDYLYAVADEGNSTLQILDISNLPNEVKVVYNSANLFRQAHNIYIDETQQRLYTFATKGGSPSYSPMRIYDISKSPIVTQLADFNTFGGVRISHVHDGYVNDNIAYLNCGNDGFFIVDFTDVNNPIVLDYLSSSNYPESGYNHSGWIGSNCDYYYMADETWGTAMKVVDVRTAGDAEVIALFDAGSDSPFSIPHNQIVACNYLYASYYYDGLQVYDLTDPTQPERVAYYSTSKKAHRRNYEGAWGVYPFLPSGNILVSDMQEGLFVLKGMEDGCEDTAKSNNCSEMTAVEDPFSKVNEISIYPQPASHVLYVDVQEVFKTDRFQLFDIRGKLVQEWKMDELLIKDQLVELMLSSSLSSGIYSLSLGNGNVEKVMIVKE